MTKYWLIQIGRKYWKFVNPVAFIGRIFILKAGKLGVRSINCLDIGAGTAPYAKSIRRAFGVEHYVAMDIAPTDRCVLVGDGCALPLIDSTFNLVVSFDVIQHVATPGLMITEIARVLKPGGYVMFTFPFFYAECDFHDYHRWTIEGMNAELTRGGFEVVIEQRRGGLFFAGALTLNWTIQHMIPGGRSSWRSTHSPLGLLRAGLVILLTVPTMFLGWIGLLLDCLLPTRGCYMGGVVLARKSKNETGMGFR